MNSCCHSCPKAAHLNEVSSLPYKFRDGKQHFEKNVNSRMPKRCFYSAAQMGENFTPLHPPSAKKKKKNIYREKMSYRFECYIATFILGHVFTAICWIFTAPFLLPLVGCQDSVQGPCSGSLPGLGRKGGSSSLHCRALWVFLQSIHPMLSHVQDEQKSSWLLHII